MASAAKAPKKRIADVMLCYAIHNKTTNINRDNQHQLQRVSWRSFHLLMEFMKNKFVYPKCPSELRFYLVYYKLFVS